MDSGEVNILLFLYLIFQFYFTFILYTLLNFKFNNLLNLVIFNFYKLDSITPAVLEVRHSLYSLILQGFVLLRVVNFIIDIFW
jgi:hypothetical protein